MLRQRRRRWANNEPTLGQFRAHTKCYLQNLQNDRYLLLIMVDGDIKSAFFKMVTMVTDFRVTPDTAHAWHIQINWKFINSLTAK